MVEMQRKPKKTYSYVREQHLNPDYSNFHKYTLNQSSETKVLVTFTPGN
jgi:hypothetical protein